MKTIKQILIEAKAKIEQGWCQKTDAKDKFGNFVSADSYAAVCWCSEGAIISVVGLNNQAEDTMDILRFITNCGIVKWNDAPERTKEEVLELFDKAIDKADTFSRAVWKD